MTPPPADPAVGTAAVSTPISWIGLGAAIAGVAVFAISATLSYPLIGLLMERAGVSGVGIGLNTAMAAVAMLIAAPLAPRVLARVGLARFLSLCVAGNVLSLLAFPFWDNEIWWLAARFCLGACAAGMFLASEYWIVAAAPDAIRGRVVAAYAITLSGGMALGPAVLLMVGVDGWTPFLAAGALSALALVPLALAWRDAPVVDPKGASGALKYFWSDPSLLWAVVLFGVVEFGAMGLTPVWGVRLGFTESAAVALTMALAIGGAAAQPALGWAADRFPERPLLLLSASACVAVALVLPLLSGAYNPTVAVFALWGGMAAALYTVSLTALGGRYKGGELAAANAAIVTAYGLGALIGPLLVGGMMDAAGPHGLSIALGVPAAAFCALVIMRARRTA